MIINNQNLKLFKSDIYTLSVVFSFSLYFFSNDTTLGLGKLFFIPTALSLVFNFFVLKTIGRLEFLLFLFIFMGALPYTAYGTVDSQFLELPLTRLVLGILSFIGLKEIGLKKLIKWLTLITPMILFIHYFYSDLSEYRYGGFYGDPNYLAISFQFLIVINLLALNIFHNKFLKILTIVNIFAIFPLILFGLSRAGMATTVLVLLFYWFYLLKVGNKKSYIYLGILLLILIGFSGYIQVMFEERIDSLIGRLDELQSDVRNEINRIALEAFFSHDYNFFLGFGYGNTETDKFLEITGIDNHRVHNSYICTLVEQGIIGLGILMSMILLLAKKILFNRSKFKVIKIGLFFAMLINLYSVFCFSFLSFWVTFFFLFNDWSDLEDTEINI